MTNWSLESKVDVRSLFRQEKRTALHQASRHGHKHVVELLLKAGVSIGQEDAVSSRMRNFT